MIYSGANCTATVYNASAGYDAYYSTGPEIAPSTFVEMTPMVE
jgi:hypothetical protein